MANNATNATSLSYSKIGTNVEYAMEDGYCYLRFRTDRENGEPSDSGKTLMIGTTHGFVRGLPGGLKVSLNAGYPIGKGGA